MKITITNGKGCLDLIPSNLDLDMLSNVTDMQLKMQLSLKRLTNNLEVKHVNYKY